MQTTIPTELLDLKARLNQWRATRKYIREPMPDELRRAVRNVSDRYPRPLVRRVLKIDPWRLNGLAPKKPERTAAPAMQRASFFQLPADALLPEPLSAGLSAAHCRLQIERPDGSRLTLTLPALDLASTRQICADFLRGREQ